MAYYGTTPIKTANGGTSSATLTSRAVVLGNTAGAFSASNVGTDGTLFIGGGTGFSNTRSSTTNFSFAVAAIGSAITLGCSNTDNTSSASNSYCKVSSGGSSGGNAYVQYILVSGGTNNYATGVNNATSSPEVDNYVQCKGTTLGVTDNLRIQKSGLITWPRNPCFLSRLNSNVLNVTGNGAVYALGTTALTETFDQHNDLTTAGVFTAPATGVFDLRFCIKITGTSSSKVFTLSIVTSNRTYQYVLNDTSLSGAQSVNLDALCDMDTSDTAIFTISVFGEVSDTDDIAGSATLVTFISGRMVA